MNRLVFAETLAQRTVQGTVTEEMKAEEKRMGLYLDAGLLGIDLGEVAAKRAMGQTEEEIVEEAYNRLKLKRDKENGGTENASSEPARKKSKRDARNGETTTGNANKSKDIEDALVAVGALFRLQSQGASDGETESEGSKE